MNLPTAPAGVLPVGSSLNADPADGHHLANGPLDRLRPPQS